MKNRATDDFGLGIYDRQLSFPVRRFDLSEMSSTSVFVDLSADISIDALRLIF